MLCANCNLQEARDGKDSCSRSCAHALANRRRGPRKEETKERISKSLRLDSKLCPICQREFTPDRSRRKTCSRSCSQKLICQDPDRRSSFSERMKKAPHRGWHHRGRKTPSFAERFWMDVFSEHGIAYEREKRFNCSDLGMKGTRVFLDFFFPRLNLDLEIDGVQHRDDPEVMLRDSERDLALTRKGIRVVRIPWRGLKDRRVLDAQIAQVLREVGA